MTAQIISNEWLQLKGGRHGSPTPPEDEHYKRSCASLFSSVVLVGITSRGKYFSLTMDSHQNKRATRFDMLQVQAYSPQTQGLENTADQYTGAHKSHKKQENPDAKQGRSRKILKGTPKPLKLPTIAKSGWLAPVVRNGSPWDSYKAIFTCELAGTVSICENRGQSSKLVAIRSSARPDGEEMLRKYVTLRHINIMSAIECFKGDEWFYFLVEDLPVTLEHLVASDAYPTEAQLASILKQVSYRNCPFQNTKNTKAEKDH